MTTAALVVAGGSGSRAGGEVPKQYRKVAGKAVIRWALEAFLAHPRIDVVQVVIGEGHGVLFAEAVKGLSMPMPVTGGRTRQESVRNGLEALARREMGAPDVVLIHDAARPFVRGALIDRLLDGLGMHEGVVPGLEVTDTIKRVNEEGIVVETPPRDRLRAVQTPQVFYLAPILAAHRHMAEAGRSDLTDDAAVAEAAGFEVAVVPGDPVNRKITHPEDFAWAEETAVRLAGGAEGR
jgi:2-C-methyl-D-erythritol 4-phosphate cytidylyltransferase/2-C-methyl-D-erythritol 2,4-cyclodiphosphate synthase